MGQRRADSNAERPAPGFRLSTSGALSDVGNSGYSWAFAINIKDVYLIFNTIGLIPNYTTDRAHGFQLRCLSE